MGLTESDVVHEVGGEALVEIDSPGQANPLVGLAVGVAKARNLGQKDVVGILRSMAALTPCMSINRLIFACGRLPEALEFSFECRVVERQVGWRFLKGQRARIESRVLGTNHDVA